MSTPQQLPGLPFEPKTVTIKKGSVVLQQGQVSRYAYRVISGCLKSYFIDHDGKQHIFQFAPEDWFITDMNSLLNQQPAVLSIDALEDTEAGLYPGSALSTLPDLLSNEVLVQHIRLLQNNIISANRRIIHLLSSTAEERYLDFIHTYPSLMQRLPFKYIASYLGLTPESLSRIRKRMAHK